MLIATQKGKQKVPIKRKTYIYTYIGKKKKRVQSRTQKDTKKEGLFLAPLITRQMYAYSAVSFVSFSVSSLAPCSVS